MFYCFQICKATQNTPSDVGFIDEKGPNSHFCNADAKLIKIFERENLAIQKSFFNFALRMRVDAKNVKNHNNTIQ